MKAQLRRCQMTVTDHLHVAELSRVCCLPVAQLQRLAAKEQGQLSLAKVRSNRILHRQNPCELASEV